MPTELPNERPIREAGSMALDPSGEGVATDETRRLIASSKVEGTAVYDRAGESIGAIHNFMVDKVSGQVAYAVLSVGGFLGLGETHHPLPWNALTYSVELSGYVVDIDPAVLDGASVAGPGSGIGSDAPLARAADAGVAGLRRAPTA